MKARKCESVTMIYQKLPNALHVIQFWKPYTKRTANAMVPTHFCIPLLIRYTKMYDMSSVKVALDIKLSDSHSPTI